MVGTMPWKEKGKWVLEYEKLARLRPHEILFLSRKSYDNIAALGHEYFRRQRAILPAIIYSIEIENERVKAVGAGFYPNFDEEKHTYTNNVYDPTKPLKLSFDFGATVTSLTIGQLHGDTLYLEDFLYTMAGEIQLNEEALPSDENTPLHRTVRKFIAKYKKGKVEIYGDVSGFAKSDRAEPSFSIVEKLLKAAGFIVSVETKNNGNPLHERKYTVINEVLSESDPKRLKVRIHETNCDYLILSIKMTPVLDDYKKDKRSERKQGAPIEETTHPSDSFDYIIMGNTEMSLDTGYDYDPFELMQ
jgi:hypothetical protein